MGMFDLIDAKLKCSVIKKTLEHKIYVKWRENRSFEHFKIGDKIKDLISEYNNIWIKTDYICESCSKKTKSKNYGDYVKVEDQKRHDCFIKIKNKQLKQILNAGEFYKLDVKRYINDL